MNTDRKVGTIVRLVRDRAFGFLRVDGDRDYFFHQAQLEGCFYAQLTEGDPVSFTVGPGPGGKIEAQDVQLLDRAHPVIAPDLPAPKKTRRRG